MPVSQSGAQRASHDPSRAFPIILLLAGLLAVGGLVTQPHTVRAAAAKVVIVVGPTGSQTADYIAAGKRYATLARSYGATVHELYSPYATWSRVKQYGSGANLLIYLGHGNGWPSPYAPYQPYTKDGMGLNASYGSKTQKYYGEYYIKTELNLAANAVVILNRLCYASGNNEWGVTPDPSLSTARQRVDNFGAGFLGAGASAVFAEGITDAGYIITGLFTRPAYSLQQVFWSSPKATRTYKSGFQSSRTKGAIANMDPAKPGKYYRSVIGNIFSVVSSWR